MVISQAKLYLLIVIACLAGYIWLFVAFYTIQSNYEVNVCFFKHATNIPCPSCGSSRAVLSLIKGEFSESILFNPIGVILFLIMTVSPAWILFDFILKKDTFYQVYHKFEILLKNKRIAVPAILLVLINWIWNIYKGV